MCLKTMDANNLWKRRRNLALWELFVGTFLPFNLSLPFNPELVWYLAPPQELLWYGGYIFYICGYIIPLAFALASSISIKHAVVESAPVSRSVKLEAQFGVSLSILFQLLTFLAGITAHLAVVLIIPLIELLVLIYHGFITFQLPGCRAEDFREKNLPKIKGIGLNL